jgi:hypothetical protein
MWNGGNPFGGNSPYQTYATNTTFRDIQNAGAGFMRNVFMDNIGSDVFRPGDGTFSVNLTIMKIDPGETGAHPDFFQCYCVDDTAENVIVYNTKAYNMTAQGIFGCNDQCFMQDAAIVNLLLEKDPPESYLMSQPGYQDHTLWWHITTADQGWLMRTPSSLSHLDVRNCNFSAFSAGDVTTFADSYISHNHTGSLAWDQPAAIGLEATTGDQGFVDYDNDDYRVTDQSPCYASGAPIPDLPADVDGVLYDTVSPNRGCFAKSNVSAARESRRAAAGKTGRTVRWVYASGGEVMLVGAGLADGTRLAVYDMAGRAVLKGAVGHGCETVGWEGTGTGRAVLAPGVYCVGIVSGSGDLHDREQQTRPGVRGGGCPGIAQLSF